MDPSRALLPLLALLVLASAVPFPAVAQEARPTVVAVAVEGVVGPHTVMDVERALEVAEERDAPLVVRLNTPGGLVSSTRELVELILNADVPVLTYVGPRGATAFSAGTYILLAGNLAGMEEGTTMGSAMPVQSGPGGTSAADQKTINALASFMRTIAQARDRPVNLSEEIVRNNTDYTAAEALDANLVNATATSLGAFLDQVHGTTVMVDGEARTLNTRDAQVVHVEPGLASQVVRVISNPQVAFLLMAVGFYGLIFGLAAGGTYVPETIGAILLLLGLIGLGTFDFSTAGVLLIALAALFFVAEVFTPTHGILSVAGAVSLALGALLLPTEPLLPTGWFREFRVVALGTAAFSGLFVFAIITYGLGSLRDHEVHESVEGRRGVTLQALAPGEKGQVRVRGEVWSAVADEPVPEGASVEVVERDGLTLRVRRVLAEEEPGEPHG